MAASSTRKLILAEKPQVARDLAKVLRVSGRSDGALVGEHYVITWCIGHLVELCEPHEYDAAWKPWRIDRLPMLPSPFKLRPISGSFKQWRAVKKLLQDRTFSSVINACDAGREGELIFRLCYELAGCRLPIERLWISSLTEQAIEKGIAQLRPGRDFDDLARAARCRSEADWLVGMNATRAVTVWRRGEQQVLCSLGRVQTPTLGLLVSREQQIRQFVPADYFEVHVQLHREKEPGQFVAQWHFGKVRRLRDLALAAQLVTRDQSAPIVVEQVEEKRLREPPPLLFDLTSLQRTCNRRFGFSAQHTLALAQKLYEQHKLLSYPRTDSRHLGRDLIGQLSRLFSAVGESPTYAGFATQAAERSPPSRVFQDHKVTDHHAIIPTTTSLSAQRLSALSVDERKLHDLVVRRFLGAFFPDAEFAQTTVTVRVDANGVAPNGTPEPDEQGRLTTLPGPPDRYVAQGKQRLVAGWQQVAGLDGEGPTRRKPSAEDADGDEETDDGLANQALPRLHKGDLLVGTFAVQTKQTKPPPRYSDASLLAAMESAGKQLSDEELRRAMRDAGLGTPATRASVIETLISRRYIERRGKQLWPTALGIDLIEKLPDPSLASAELTGQWEARLNRMARGEESPVDFMRGIVEYVQQFIGKVRTLPAPMAIAVESESATRAGGRPVRAEALAKVGRKPRREPSAPGPRTWREATGSAVAEKPLRKQPTARAQQDRPLPGTKVLPTLRCPRCGAASLIWGKQAWGCGDYRTCRLVIPFVVADASLSLRNLATLVTTGKVQLSRHGKRQQLRLTVDGEPSVQSEAKAEKSPSPVRKPRGPVKSGADLAP